MKVLKEFKEFAIRGNVVDLAVGIIIGSAFGNIVTSLVNDVIMPPIGALLKGVDFKDLSLPLVDVSNLDDAALAAAPVIRYGEFINVLLNFIIVAFCIFLMVKGINALRRMNEKPAEAPPAEPAEKECPFCLSQVPVKAVRCKHCTSQLETASNG